jgi:hypothetical protein
MAQLLFPQYLQRLLAQDTEVCRAAGGGCQNRHPYQGHCSRQPLYVEREIQAVEQDAGAQIGENHSNQARPAAPTR